MNNTWFLKWDGFSKHLYLSLNNKHMESNFFDVTLVSDEHIPFRAHKFLLTVYSSVLKDLLLYNPHEHPILYPKGVKH